MRNRNDRDRDFSRRDQQQREPERDWRLQDQQGSQGSRGRNDVGEYHGDMSASGYDQERGDMYGSDRDYRQDQGERQWGGRNYEGGYRGQTSQQSWGGRGFESGGYRQGEQQGGRG